MNVRSDVAVKQMELVVKVLGYWTELLENLPSRKVRDGIGNVVGESKISNNSAVVEVIGEVNSLKLKAELSTLATMLHGLSDT